MAVTVGSDVESLPPLLDTSACEEEGAEPGPPARHANTRAAAGATASATTPLHIPESQGASAPTGIRGASAPSVGSGASGSDAQGGGDAAVELRSPPAAVCPEAPTRLAYGGTTTWLSEAIRNRAREVARPLEYIGLFELCAWCALRRRGLSLILGRNVMNILEYYPQVAALIGDLDTTTHACIAGCTRHPERNSWMAVHNAYQRRLQHYVVAVRTPFEAPPPSDVQYFRDVEMQNQALGYMTIPTAAQGDCGIDALSYWDSECERSTPAQWKALRLELHRFMNEHCDDEVWQELFVSCQEVYPALAPASEPPRSAASGDAPRGATGVGAEGSVDSSDSGDSDSEVDPLLEKDLQAGMTLANAMAAATARRAAAAAPALNGAVPPTPSPGPRSSDATDTGGQPAAAIEALVEACEQTDRTTIAGEGQRERAREKDNHLRRERTYGGCLNAIRIKQSLAQDLVRRAVHRNHVSVIN